MKNAFYAQSGGVTSVINTSAYGVISELSRLDKSINVYAGQNGIVGLLENNLYDLSKTKKDLSLLKDSPAGMFGSCRYKLPELTEKEFYDVYTQDRKLNALGHREVYKAVKRYMELITADVQ